MNDNKHALIFGATGNIGGAVVGELLRRGWRVRGVTRNPQSEKALTLSRLGAEMVQADMDDPASLAKAFDGTQYVFSVQSWMICGVNGEVRQGKLVADAARAANVKHLVYGSAGIGVAGTGIPHFESKVVVLFQKMAGAEMVQMWRWMVDWIEKEGPESLGANVEASRQVHPEIHDVKTWLRMSPNGQNRH